MHTCMNATHESDVVTVFLILERVYIIILAIAGDQSHRASKESVCSSPETGE